MEIDTYGAILVAPLPMKIDTYGAPYAASFLEGKLTHMELSAIAPFLKFLLISINNFKQIRYNFIIGDLI